ncbi:hypothetical protein FE251_04860 [Georgenia wutianyii]|uniref:CBM6 domain-containing protein n=1 Tax=Georgenia wutianyii TaxID=2585135 RepID=A0ABX5VKU4_9MICO|nr:hypothetical protein FE251_04860 [Georgenia wutianyii]
MTSSPSTEPRRRTARQVAASVTAAVLVATGSAAAAPVAQAASDALEIDFAVSTGPFKGGASGMLYGLGDDGVPTDAIIAGAGPHHLTQKAPRGAQHPNGDPLEVERAFFENGGEYMMTNIQDYYPDWPYTGGRRPDDFESYLEIVRTVVADVVENSDYPERYVFTPFNEPDGINWYGNWEQMGQTFLADWKAAYETIKEVYPEARIAGPGDSRWQPARTREFLTFAKENDVLPDMFTWHELGRNNLATYRSNYDAYRALERELGIGPLPININEYAMRRDMSVPGNIVQWLTMFEDTKVDAQTAYWTYAGNLNDNMAKSNSANGAWWLLKWYADLGGDTVQVTPPVLNRPDTLQGIATLDPGKRQATVLFGGTDNEVRLELSGLDPAVFGDVVDIQIREAEWSGQEGEAQAPPVVATHRLALDDVMVIDVANDDRLSAYQAVITPALPTQPTVDPTWRVEVEAEDTVLRDVTAYNQSPTDDWTFAASRGRDVGSTNRVTSSLTWTVDVPADGTYRFGAVAGVNGPANGPGRHALFVDGVQASTIDYEAGFSWGYRGRAETLVELTAGSHELSVRMSADGSTLLPGSDISLDKFDLTLVTGPETTTYPAVFARSGDATVDYTAADGGAVEVSGDGAITFFPSVRETGYYDVALEYATEGAAGVDLAVNRRAVDGVGASAAGEWVSTARVHLGKGVSEVTVGAPDGALVSSLTVTRAAEADSETVTIEAEDSSQVTLHGEARTETVAQPTNVSGEQVGQLGGGEGNYAVVARPEQLGAGQYNLSVRYANAERNTGHDYNTDVITRFLDIGEEGGETTRGGFRHNYSWQGFWTHTVPVDLTTDEGDLRLGNATGNAPNIDWIQLSPLTLGVTNTAGGELAIDSAATVRCVAGRAHVVVRVTNESAVPVAVEIGTPFGTRSVAGLDAGRAVSVAFASRQTEIAAGTASVVATGLVDGSPVTSRADGTYLAAACG